MKSEGELRRLLSTLDGRGYKAYKRLAGAYRFAGFEMYVDHVQGDPFAASSKLRLRVPQDVARIPRELFDSRPRRVAAEDYLGRSVRRSIIEVARGSRGTGKSGAITIDAGGQEVLERTAVVLNDRWVEARIQVGLPAAGRRIRGADAAEMLAGELPEIVRRGLFWGSIDAVDARAFVDTIDNYHAIRDGLAARNLVAFVPEGAVLPRESGASERPKTGPGVVPFAAPAEYRVEFDLRNPQPGSRGDRRVAGMGIPRGVTLIVGGGYHGKSTLLRALERGVYPHVPGDGRELLATDPTAVKIRAEDGRRVYAVNISPFVENLPYGGDTGRFVSEDASGSTSQAANIVEAVEVGAATLLIDEDTSATNFMIRDARMQALIEKSHEPITPFVDRVRELSESHGVSTVLVMGGCGDYFDVADHVIGMRDYLPYDATRDAREIARSVPTGRRSESPSPMRRPEGRVPDPAAFDPSRGRRSVKIDAASTGGIRFGRHTIDLSGIDQLVDRSQTAAVGDAVYLSLRRWMPGGATMAGLAAELEALFDTEGLDVLDPFHRPGRHPGCYARPRALEVIAAINRLRTLRTKNGS